MNGRTQSPWSRHGAANDNNPGASRGKRTQGPAVDCDLPVDPGIIEGEVDLLTRFFDLILADAIAANDNEASGRD